MSLGSLKVCPVILVMTMERVRAWIVIDKIDLDGAETRHVDRVFQSLRSRLFYADGLVFLAAQTGHGEPIVQSELHPARRVVLGRTSH